MRERSINAFFYLTLFSIFTASLVWAVPPEGVEMALLNKEARPGSQLYANLGFVNPVWTSDYESLQSYVSIMNSKKNVFSYGVLLTAGNSFGDRDAYFVRYDQTFYSQSLSLKLAHLDFRFLGAGKNTLSLDYNASFGAVQKSRFYFSGGLYYRASLYSWDPQPWNPLNFNTEDHEYYFEMCFGNKTVFSQSFYVTVDMNNRDPFVAYNGDNLAFDLTLNFSSSNKFEWRITSSTRFTGLLAGNGDIGEQSLFFGIITRF